MDRTRQRYNAKARQSTAGSHKKKGRRKDIEALPSQHSDPNAPIIDLKTLEQKEDDRKERLRKELLAQSDSKASSKKKKRLEKYIEKKLKQEERVVLFEKLSKSQAQLSIALQLQSSSTLGTGKPSTHKQLLDTQEDRDVRRAMERQTGKTGHQQSSVLGVEESVSDEDGISVEVDREDDGSLPAAQSGDGLSKSDPIVVVDSGSITSIVPTAQPAPTPSVVGSALHRNPDGSVVAPRIVKRKPKSSKIHFSSWTVQRSAMTSHDSDAESDSSFNSSDSAYDDDSADEGASKPTQDEEREEDPDVSSESGSALGKGERGSPPPEDALPTNKRKRGGFKEWAMKQLSAAKGYVAPVEPDTPSDPPEQEIAPPPKKRKVETSEPREVRGPLGEDLQLPSTTLARHLQETAGKPASVSITDRRKVIGVHRPPEVQEARLLLPMVAEEQPIMEAILFHNVVIICGETGSGKTTQVPQFLFEAGYGSPGGENPGMIGITQPRRVAAISMASRVAHELGFNSSRVSYQIRYDATVSPSTSIKFMTDGVLLRELATDFLLKKYSVIIVDEAHERSMNTDILIGVLSRVIKLREEMWRDGKNNIKPLRLIIMSATLRVSDFAENKTLFSSPPPIINVPARQHLVTIHFSRRTSSDYVTEAIRKASKIHARLPPGGILIFLTGQNEISGVCRQLEAKYGKKTLDGRRQMRKATQQRLGNQTQDEPENVHSFQVTPSQADVEAEDLDLGNVQQDGDDLAFDIDGDVDGVNADDEALDSDDASAVDQELGIHVDESDTPMHVVPLYALLSSEKQMQVFQPPPAGTRLVVVSTNVAETSLTIPGIRYVVDCGRAKERRHDVANGIQAFRVSWISKASAAQRAGRAGRTGPGHCYRLYSSALYEHYFDQFSQPEILRVPIEGVVLQMKSMHIDAVVNFPFPTPPDRLHLRKAETVLTHLGALKAASGSDSFGGDITDIGKAMSLFPLSPRYSRMLVSGRQHGCLPYVIEVVSALSVGDPFLREETLGDDGEKSEEEHEEVSHLTSAAVRAAETRKIRRRAFFQSQQTHASLGNFTSDIFRTLSVVGAYEYAGGGHAFCSEQFVRPKAMEEIHNLRTQISNIVQANFPDLETGFVADLRPPSTLQLKVLRQLITAGFIDQIAVRKDVVEAVAASGAKYTTSKGVAYRALGISEDVFIHPSSVLASAPPPDYIVFLEVVRTSRIWLKGLTVVNAAWLSSLGRSLCTYSKPVKAKDGQSMVIPHFGPGGWELPAIEQC
ncbi:Putative ATP-dependent RNA helicase [Sparassis crispa]|uniref:RNA helicase n=1 Tax=Sparassis crispa TaxID=139825 RepID=A0A401GRT6_9APHY|nr:Putative ATP-dependent RNA helicase [Sparassis crispa]GBE84926.1 Putative ATP-dependent RNA helicase [Sparassis crispa]